MSISKITDTTNCIKPSGDIGLFQKKELPPGILSFEDFCKENGINPGLADCDLMMRNFKKAQALYNEYLKENNVEINDPLSKLKEIPLGTKGLDPKSIYC